MTVFTCAGSKKQVSLGVPNNGRFKENFTSRPSARPQLIGNIVESVFDSVGLAQRFHASQVIDQWSSIVGEQIARHARAARFAEGVLYVVVEDAAWRQNLSMELEPLLQKIRQHPCGRVVTKLCLIAHERG